MLLEAKNISFRYRPETPQVLSDYSFSLESGESIALVGKSGCGKSTLAKILTGYLKADKGQVSLDKEPLPSKGYMPVQLIHQHPEHVINPRWKMGKVLEEYKKPSNKILSAMAIEEEWFNRYPSELSGGELQRFCLARALVPEAKFLICDEISTMLDVITQAQLWDLIKSETQKNNTGLLLITHNIHLAEKVCDKVVYM